MRTFVAWHCITSNCTKEELAVNSLWKSYQYLYIQHSINRHNSFVWLVWLVKLDSDLFKVTWWDRSPEIQIIGFPIKSNIMSTHVIRDLTPKSNHIFRTISGIAHASRQFRNIWEVSFCTRRAHPIFFQLGIQIISCDVVEDLGRISVPLPTN